MGVPGSSESFDLHINILFLQAGTSLVLTRADLYIVHFLPRVITLEVKTRGSSEFTLLQAYVLNDQSGSCEEFDSPGVSCSNFSVGARDRNGNTNISALLLPMDIQSVCLMLIL